MIVCIPVSDDGQVGAGWGRARRLALASTGAGGHVETWQEIDVGWDVAHDEGTEGSHHARVARFVREHEIGVVVVSHLGEPMARMLGKLGVRTLRGAHGDARVAVQDAVRQLADPSRA